MDLRLSQEQEMIRDGVTRFVRDDYEFATRRIGAVSDLGFREEVWQQFADLGWLGAALPEEYGGFGGSAIETMILMEAFGRGLVLEPYLWSVVLGGALLQQGATSAHKEQVLPEISSGKARIAFAFAEPGSRFNLAHIGMTAKKDGDGYRLNGNKTVVYYAASAEYLIGSARLGGAKTDREGIALFLLPSDAKGITRRDYATQDDQRASEIIFKDVQVDAAALFKCGDDALPVIENAIDVATAAICADAVGAMGALREMTLEYLKTRKQFGRAIGEFQVLQHRMAEMFILEEEARSMALRAALMLDAPAPARKKAVSAAKSLIARAGRQIGQEAVQMHGGMGMTHELSVGHYFKRLTMIGSMFGDGDFHRKRFAAL
jgi:alkylation response protein AidB-like acyl-CoA dehydrogenase